MTTSTTHDDIAAAECLLFLSSSRESNQTQTQCNDAHHNTEHSTQSTLSLPGIHESSFGQSYPQAQLPPRPQFHPAPQLQLPPQAQLLPRAQNPHQAQILPGAQSPPRAQRPPRAQNPPRTQKLSRAQNSYQAQNPHQAQILPGAQNPPRAQRLPRTQHPPQAQILPRPQHPPRVQLPPGRSNILSTPSAPLNIPSPSHDSNQQQRSYTVPNQQQRSYAVPNQQQRFAVPNQQQIAAAVPNQQPQLSGTYNNPEVALQAYLIRQQLIAGIQPQNIIPMRQQSNNTNERTPALVQINNEGITVPNIPPASFSGSFQPIPRDQLASIPLQPAGAVEARPQIAAQTRAPSNTFIPARPASALAPKETESRTVQQQPRDIGRQEARPVPQQARNIAPQEARPMPQQPQDIGHPALNMGPTHGAEIQPPAQAQDPNIPHGGYDLLRGLSYYPQISILLTSYLDIEDIVNLGALSKPFHQFLSTHLGHIIPTIAAARYPFSAFNFPFLCYPKLCTIPGQWCNPQPQDRQYNLDLLVPSIPWLRMIAYRENMVEEILILLCEAGYNLPVQCIPPVMKLWALMDIPDNERREWTVRNRRLWQDGDIFLAVLFLVQLDMYLRKSRGQQSNSLRRLIMAQPTLTFLHDYIKGTVLQSPTHVLLEYVRWKYAPEVTQGERDVFGVPIEEAGNLQYEWYGKRGRGEEPRVKLRRPDDRILLELTSRGLSSHDMYIEFFVTGRGSIFYPLNRMSVSWVAEMRAYVEQNGGNWMDAVRLD
ncbi:hypothetical protein AbraIFM66950_009890 [Aspergillus brasiliensis]|nr:hypothetical protein AbraIFM66950_009890 [Aspergillus brasiliensis]